MIIQNSQSIQSLKPYQPIRKENKQEKAEEADLKQKIRAVLGEFKANRLTEGESVNRLYQLFKTERK